MIFFNRNIPRSVVERLREVRDDVMWFEPTFRHDAADAEWLAEAGAHGWIVVTRDRRIRSRPAEIDALVSHGVGTFILRQRRPMSASDVLDVVSANLDGMERLDRETPRPYLFSVSRTAGIRRIAL